MNQMVGYLIRSNRVKKKMSQEKLCKGICAISYLSKIEAGIAEPNETIIEKLFNNLGITYVNDQELINEYKDLFARYFDAYFHQEKSAEIEERIYKNKDRIQASPLAIEYQLFCVYQASDEKAVAAKLLKGMDGFKDYFNDETSFLYYMAKGRLADSYDQRVRAYIRARQIKDSSLCYEALMYEAYNRGEYLEALRYCTAGYARAMEEGFLLVARQLSFLEGMCYGKLGDLEAMLMAYNRTRELFRGDDKISANIDYNIAMAYMAKAHYDDAIPYLLSALKKEQEELALFFINHRLAMAYKAMDEEKIGEVYLSMAETFAKKLGSVYGEMVKLAKLYYKDRGEGSDEYGTILLKLYDMEDEMGQDFVAFYRPYVIDYLKSKRKYKEAMRLIEEM